MASLLRCPSCGKNHKVVLRSKRVTVVCSCGQAFEYVKRLFRRKGTPRA